VKVLFVTREYPPFEVGGVARHTFNLVRSLEGLGVDCRVVSFGDSSLSNDGVLFVEPSSSVLSRGNRPLGMDVRIPFDLARFTGVVNALLAREGFDVVHVEEPYVGAFVRFPRKVTTVHDTSYGELRSIVNQGFSSPNLKRAFFYVYMGFFLERACMASSRLLVAPFAHVKRELLWKYGVAEPKVRVIGNGVELPRREELLDREVAKLKLGLVGVPLVFAAAQHVARKRLETLVEAVRLLHLDGAGLRVVIAGDGPLRGQLAGLAKGYGLGEVVVLPGWVSREALGLYYRAADVFVLTSEYEAGPISLLEAMSYGTSVVSSRIEGFPSLLREGVDGLLFPVGDALALSECLRLMLGDEGLRRRSSEAGRAFAERFSWERVAEETLALYEELV